MAGKAISRGRKLTLGKIYRAKGKNVKGITKRISKKP